MINVGLDVLAGLLLAGVIFWLLNVWHTEFVYRASNPPPQKFNNQDLVRVKKYVWLNPMFYVRYAHAQRKAILGYRSTPLEVWGFNTHARSYYFRNVEVTILEHMLDLEFNKL